MIAPFDALDARLLALFAAEPRVRVLEASRRLGVARGTVQARLDRMTRNSLITGWGPDLDPSAFGYGVTAYVTMEIRQGVGHNLVADHLARIPEVIEAHTISGSADMLARLVARSNADLQRVLDEVLGYDGIMRTSTTIALTTQVAARTLPLAHKVAEHS